MNRTNSLRNDIYWLVHPLHRMKAVHRPRMFLWLTLLSCMYAHTAATSATTIKPGFDCTKGHSRNEQLICNDPELARTDHELNLVYVQVKLATRNSAAFRKTHNEEWLWREKHCHDKNCLLRWYANRRSQLTAMLNQHNPGSSSSSTSFSTSVSSASVSQPSSAIPMTVLPVSTSSNESVSQQMVTLPLIKRPLLWGMIIGIILFISLAWDALSTDSEARKRARTLARAVNSNIDAFLEQHGNSGHASDMHDPKKWEREKRRFIEDMVKPALTDSTPLSITDTDHLSLIIDYVAWGVKHRNNQYQFRGHLEDGEQRGYRQFCTRVLKHYGWKVKLLSGGQPENYLLATRKSCQIVVLCKAQSLPVGTDALRDARFMQERHGAKQAVVISNAPFTTSAEREASTCAALLLNHLRLSMLATMAELQATRSTQSAGFKP